MNITTPTSVPGTAQTSLSLHGGAAHGPADADAATTAADRTGFEIGWDHAQRGLVPPAELLLEGTPVGQGWRAGKAVFGGRTLGTQRCTRLWLALRTQAWRLGIAYEGQQLTANYLAQIQVEHCPITRRPLGGSADHADALVVERIDPRAGYAAGNVAVISRAAADARADARAGAGVLDALRLAHRIGAGDGEPVAGLNAAAWWRLAALRSYATPLPFHEAARVPMALLPPNRVRLLNAVQGLQALLTMQFAKPGWAARTRAIAALLPEHTLRHDYNLFIGAMAPRVLEAETARMPVRQALEDAWLNERVQRRWQHFALSLGEAGTTALLDRAAAMGLAGVRTLLLGHEQAVDGWAREDEGRVVNGALVADPAAPAASRAPRKHRLAQPARPLQTGLARA